MSLLTLYYSQTYLLLILLIHYQIILISSSSLVDTEGDKCQRRKFSDIIWVSKDLKSDFKKFPKSPDNRDVIVHLHDWTYKKIEEECSNLREIGYAAVQLSPVTTYAQFDSHPWDERFSVINYDFDNESGNEKELKSMIKVCNKSNIKVFVDIVINNMARSTDFNDKGEGFWKMEYKSKDGTTLYTETDFHEKCKIEINDYFTNTVDFNDKSHKVNIIRSYRDPKRGSVKEKQSESIKDQYKNNKKLLKTVQELYKKQRDKKGFDITSFLIDRTRKEILWTCMLDERHDLKLVDDESRPKKQILDLFNRLIYLGVSGFRILIADHMKIDHLHNIYDWLPPLKPLFIYHDVYDPAHRENTIYMVHSEEYAIKTRATDYKYANLLSKTFLSRKVRMRNMYKLQKELDLLPSEDSVIFVNNFITLRLGTHGIGQPSLQEAFIHRECSEEKKALMLATSFMLIHGHGIPLITSSYCWDGNKKVYDNEHSWDPIKQMIQFRNVLKKYNRGVIPPPDKFREYGLSQSTFCVGTTGFVAYNNENPEKSLEKTVDTCFDDEGEYCDLIGGGLNTGEDARKKPCKGKSMKVYHGGKKGELKMDESDGLAAFHIDAMVPFQN